QDRRRLSFFEEGRPRDHHADAERVAVVDRRFDRFGVAVETNQPRRLRCRARISFFRSESYLWRGTERRDAPCDDFDGHTGTRHPVDGLVLLFELLPNGFEVGRPRFTLAERDRDLVTLPR